jgi:hypothetical protein
MTKKINWLKTISIGIFSFCLLSTSWVVAAAQEAGQVLMATGQASAKGVDGQVRPLARKTSIFVGDTIDTGKESQLQIRMKDGAMLAIGASAEFAVNAYSYKKIGDAKDGAVLSLVKGGLRTISGQIEKSTYKLQTPVATLGIRGTVFDVYVNPSDGTTVVILRDGLVDVKGDTGVVQHLTEAGLATIIQKGKAPTTPEPPPQDILDYLRGILPFVPDNVTWQAGKDGSTIFTIGDEIVINVINAQPPTINGNGDPDIDTDKDPIPTTPPPPPPCDCSISDGGQ